jgi:hypothetical protein
MNNLENQSFPKRKKKKMFDLDNNLSNIKQASNHSFPKRDESKLTEYKKIKNKDLQETDYIEEIITIENIKEFCSEKKIDKDNEARAIGICTKTVVNNKGYIRGKFTCKKKQAIKLSKKNKTIKNKK